MECCNLTFFSGLICGVVLGATVYFLRNVLRSTEAKNEDGENTKYASDGEFKIALIVRTDLNMTKGKIAAQCGHAVVGAAEVALNRHPVLFKDYKAEGQPKCVLKIDSEEAIKNLRNVAKELNIITSLIRDAGRTQIAANTITVLAVGPARKEIINIITENLKPL